MSQLRGKVVLVDFWTYSCINCQRTLPHIEAWYREYAKDGFVVVGVHTPEFAFEHIVSNVRTEAASFSVHYPVAIDNGYKTWNAFDNEYWPADYLIDAQGNVRHVHFGEGDYSGTEQLIRKLLASAHPGLRLPPATNVPNRTPGGEMNPETYVGYERLQYLDTSGAAVVKNAPAAYFFPKRLPLGAMGLSGTWTIHAQEATAGHGAALPGQGRVPRARRPRDRRREHQRPSRRHGHGRQRAEALHAPSRQRDEQRHDAPAHVAWRAGLRLHLRLGAARPHYEVRTTAMPARVGTITSDR
jgi:thiol-disulfide isomerase/thioredoxin